jgi:hypothetical protein
MAIDLVSWTIAPFAARDQPRSKERVHTANVNNLSTLMTQHRCGSELRKKENCIESRLDDAVPIFRFFVQHIPAQRHSAGIIYQDADGTELALDPVKRGLQSGAISHINLHSNRRNTDCFQFGKHPPAFSSFRPNTATAAPASANPRAMPRPIPPLPPVTTATRPVKSNNADVFIKDSSFRISRVARLRGNI